MQDPAPHFLMELDNERTVSRLRETFLLSVIVHLLLVLLIVTQPDLFRRDALLVEPQKRDVTLLYQPPETPKLKEPPVKPVLPEAKGQEAPKAETPAPPQPLLYRPPIPPPVKAPGPGEGEELLARRLPPIGIPDFPEAPAEPPKQRPTLEPVRPPEAPPPPSQSQLRLPPIVPPSRGTDSILKGLAKERASGGGRGVEAGTQELDSQDPNFNLPGPQILSDTMGVDFDPYLLRVYLVVRRNWYSVIPEIARLGKQGRVVLQFSILRNGAVPDLVLTSGSGTESLDTAALASIRLSNPFPALPLEFPGSDIRLRFTYLYNMPFEY